MSLDNYNTLTELYNIKLGDLIFDESLNIFKCDLIYDDNLLSISTPYFRYIENNKKDDYYYFKFEFLPDSNSFYHFINKLEDYIKNKIINEGDELFGKKPVYEVINNLFQHSISIPLNIPSLPLITFRVHKDDVSNIIKDVNNNRISFSELSKHTELKLHVLVKNIEFHKYKCLINYDVVEIISSGKVCQTLECLIDNDNGNVNDNSIDSDSTGGL